MQIQTATAGVTNGSANVIASAGNDWSTATAGSLFSVIADGVFYTIATVVAPGVSPSGKWELNLTANYAGATAGAVTYAITIDFTPNFHFSLIKPGDTNTAALFSITMTAIDAVIFTFYSLVLFLTGVRWLPLVVDYTGGGTTKLDGLATVAIPLGSIAFMVKPADGLRCFQLRTGNDATNLPTIVRPADHDAGTNNKTWYSVL